jgi:hypothetical protein
MASRRWSWIGACVLAVVPSAKLVQACEYDLGQVWTFDPAPASQTPQVVSTTEPLAPTNLAPIAAWKLNTGSVTGHSSNATINSFVSQEQADVQQVWYDGGYVYVKHTDVPSHDVGRSDGNNPAYASDQHRTTRLSLNPVEAATKSNTSLGSIGVMINGALIYNASDAHSYNNNNTWFQNANVAEAVSFDIGPGHSAPGQNAQPSNSTAGQYHYHQAPTALINQVDPGNTGQHHSPLVGFAYDGFPIYGPFGYVDPANPNSGIKRISSSYKIRNDITSTGLRHSLTDGGATLAQNQWGPNVSTQYPAGYYLLDYGYASGSGDLNQYNMRFTVTPEYPQGTWAYFVTTNADGSAAYPYIIGPQYFGVVDTADLGPTGGQTTVPASARQLIFGDADVDGAVDVTDLGRLATNWQSRADWTGGDFNRDGMVDVTDLGLLASHWQQGVASALGPSFDDAMRAVRLGVASVPEPASLTLFILIGGITSLHGRRRR